MTKGAVIVVEDDAAIRRGIVDALEFEGYHVRSAGLARQGVDLLRGAECDLMLLDLVLPDGDGLDVLRQVREIRPGQPVIILTARGDETDRVAGLRLGADDYVVKPFSVKELIARVEAVLRRSPGRPQKVASLRLPGGEADLQRHEVRVGARRTELSPYEVDLLRYLAMNRGRVVTRDELLTHVWRIDPHGMPTRTIDMHVARLREKLGDSATSSEVIVTVRGKGYMLGSAVEV